MVVTRPSFGLRHLPQQLHLVFGGLGIALGRLLDLQRHCLRARIVPAEPDCGEVPPSQLGEYRVAAIREAVADLYWMVAATAVVTRVLIFIAGRLRVVGAHGLLFCASERRALAELRVAEGRRRVRRSGRGRRRREYLVKRLAK